MKAVSGPGAGTGAGTGNGACTGAGSVLLSVSSSLTARRAPKRYSTGITVAELKCKLELVVGSPASCMELELYGTDDELLGRLDCDEALLGSYELWDGCRVHVIDRSGARIGEYEDVSQVEKYEMTESDYDKRPAYGVTHSLWGNTYSLWGNTYSLWGNTYSLWGNTQPSRRGTVMYVGQTDFKPGHWVGVRYDEPLGKHDGSVGSRRYFECIPKYGAFVKPQSVTPGDFPEEELGLEEEEL
ncbi:LOW QUALITY PROTEIN: tubulin-folding cofactor B-like [Melopsittacus undulatus]|uniref:LOW QUALITY PROTEIN: tubulin-folding cofactor B-like n=1 Tax=Melopsittacus undulatus TaxID=13146 RepID=UPI00146AB578|nr:LOW QUALITY PROTEIN: tubulin-folding cofactor B-like [Melopsittacus undulatus]